MITKCDEIKRSQFKQQWYRQYSTLLAYIAGGFVGTLTENSHVVLPIQTYFVHTATFEGS